MNKTQKLNALKGASESVELFGVGSLTKQKYKELYIELEKTDPNSIADCLKPENYIFDKKDNVTLI